MAQQQRIDDLKRELELIQRELAALQGLAYFDREGSFDSLLNNPSRGNLILDAEGTMLEANDTLLTLFGVSKERVIGESYHVIFDSYRIDSEPLAQVLRGESPKVLYKQWIPKPNRQEALLEISARTLESAKQSLFLCSFEHQDSVASFDDMLRYSLDRLQDALKHASTFAITIDRHLVMSFCNDFLLGITGWEAEDLLGKNLLSIFTPVTADAGQVKVKDLFDTFDGELYTKSGPPLRVRFNSVVLNDKNGELMAMTIVGEDITEQIRMGAALAESNALLKEVFDATNDLIFIFADGGRVLYMNNACEQALGYTEAEASFMKMRDFIHPSYYEVTYNCIKTAIEQGEYKNMETSFLSRNGQKVHLIGNLSATKEEGKPTVVRAILHNYTDLVKAQSSQRLYYGIARLVEKDIPLQQLYKEIYAEIAQVINVDSFIIAVREEANNRLTFPYYTNSEHAAQPEHAHGAGLAFYAVTLKKPTFLLEEDIHALVAQGSVSPLVNVPKVWMAVPLIMQSRSVGALIIQSFKYKQDYTEKDLELLSFISGQVTSAIVRQQNEAKINRQAARLEAIFDSGNHLMWSVNRRGQLTQFNKNFAKAMRGYYRIKAKENMLFRAMAAYNGMQSLDHWMRWYRSAFHGKSSQMDVQFLQENGVEAWYEVVLNPIMDKDGYVTEVSAVANDITQKKIMGMELEEREGKFRNIFESFQDVYFRIDMKGTINMVSPSVFELMGEGASEIIGKSVTEYYLSQSKLQLLRKALLEEGSVKNFESTLIDKDGRRKNIISNFRLIYSGDGEASFIEGVARDITELKRATEEIHKAKNLAEKSLEVKKRFLSNMSHEIRTPMNGIIGMIDLLGETRLDADQRQYVNTVKKSSETLLTILNDILDLSKIEAGKMRLRKIPISLAGTVEKLYALFSQQAQAKSTIFRCVLSENMPKYIMADETRVLQVLSNLTSNAIKFTEHGQVRMVAELLSIDQHGMMELKFAVEDSGIGISEENLDLLFKQFSQVDNSYNKPYGGTGLGLAISQELSKMMGGRVGVSSEVGKGSVFWFTIRATECTHEEIAEAEARLRETDQVATLSQSYEILVVDDNAINLQVAKGIMEKAGCIVTTAQSGQQALDLAETRTFDMIFMDIQMPGMNGMTATKLLKERYGKSYGPIVAMTAFSMQEEREEFMNTGMDDFISKPVKAVNLINMVRHWMEPEILSGGKQREAVAQRQPQEEPLPSADLPVLNKETANDLKKYGGNELLQSIYGDFKAETAQLLIDCQEAVGNANWKEVLGILHTMKGTSGTLGVERFSAWTAYTETAIKAGNYAKAEELMEELLARYTEFEKLYEQILQI